MGPRVSIFTQMWQLTVEHLSTHWLQFSLVVIAGLMIGGPIQRMVERYGTLFQGFFWPIRSFCVRCLTPIGWMQRFPLIGPILFGHRCQHCGQSLGWRAVYFPLMSLVAILVPYFLWVVFGARFRPDLPRQVQFYSYVVEHQWALFIYHAIFFLFLLAAMWTDFDWFLIPDSITFPGMIVGLLLGTFWYVELHPVPVWPGYRHPADFMKEETIRQDLFNGKEIPKWIESFRKSVEFHYHMNWNRYIGFANSMLGLVFGGAMTYLIRAIMSFAFRREAIGFGDVILLMMIGTYLGWQACIIIFFLLGPLCAIAYFVLSQVVRTCIAVFGAPSVGAIPGRWVQMVWNAPNMMPYGPHLAMGAFLLVIFWLPIWDAMYIYFSIDFKLFLAINAGMLVALLFISVMVQMAKRFFNTAGDSLGYAGVST